MGLPAAACIDDEIRHTPPVAMVLKVATTIGAGLLTGLAIGVATAFIVGTGGVGALVVGAVVGAVVGMAVDAASEALTGHSLQDAIAAPIMSAIDKFFPGVPKGVIATGSPNVKINSKKAARAAGKAGAAPPPPPPPATWWEAAVDAVLSLFSAEVTPPTPGFAPVDQDKVACQDHPPKPDQFIAQGSGNVFINGQPAARAGDKTTCDAVLSVLPGRRGNVGIGGGQVTVRAITSEMPGWLGFVAKWAGFAIAVCQAMRGRGPLLKKVICLGTNMAIGMAADMGVHAVAGAVGRALSGNKGHPVHIPSGNKVLTGDDDLDFVVPARMPVYGVRRYNAANATEGLFGLGWSTLWDTRLFLQRPDVLGEGDALAVHALLDEQGRWLPLPDLAPGQRHHLAQEGLTYAHLDSGHHLLMSDDGLVLDFGVPDAPGAQVLALQCVEDPNTQRHFLSRDDQGRLVRLTTNCGQQVDLHYSVAHPARPERVTFRPAGHTGEPLLLASYAYTAQGQLSEVRDALNQLTRQFGYTAQGWMNFQRLSSGLEVRYQWSHFEQAAQANQVSQAHRSGQPGHWRVTGWQTSLGEQVELTVDVAAGHARAETRGAGLDGPRSEQWWWDADLRVLRYADALDQQTELAWHPEQRQLLALHAPGGADCTFEYDERGNLSTVQDPLGRRTHTQWHEQLARPLSRTSLDGSAQHWAYDEVGNLLSATYQPVPSEAAPPDLVERWVHDEHGQVVAHTDVRGGTQFQAYTAHGQVRRFTDCSGRSTAMEWGERGELLTERDAAGRVTQWRHDALGQPLTARLPDGSEQHWRWSEAGQLLASVSANPQGQSNGDQRRYAYNPLGQLLRQVDPLGQAVEYGYNAVGELQSLRDTAGQVTRFEQDALGRLIGQVGCDGLRTEYRLDAQGWPVAVTQGAGSAEPLVTRLERDVIGRLLVKHTGHSLSRYGYDKADRLTRVQRWAALDPVRPEAEPPLWDEHQFVYDAHGHLAEEHAAHWPQQPPARFDGDTAPKRTPRRSVIRHQHDALGVRTATTLPGPDAETSGQTLNYLHYGSGHLHQINLDGRVISDIERDALHREVQRTQGNLRTLWGRDALGRPTWQMCVSGEPHLQTAADRWASLARPLAPWTPMSKGYRWDARGELAERRDAVQGEQHLRYDALGRITASRNEPIGQVPDAGYAAPPVPPDAFHPDWREQFDWDAGSNPSGGVTASASGQPAGYVRHNRLLTFQDQRYEYDLHGRLIHKRVGRHTEQSLKWNAEHQLTEVTTRRNGTPQTVRFEYDALGRRIAKHHSFGSTHFVWEGLRLLQEQHARRTTTLVYEPGSYAPLARIDTTPHADHAYFQDGEVPPPRLYWFHTNVSGAPEELTDQEGRIHWRGRYQTWGNLALQETPDAESDRYARPKLDDQPLRFQGQYADSESGLHYNTFRYYDPDCGRFISQDPIGLAGGVNLYQYAPNPVGWIDPWGWFGEKPLNSPTIEKWVKKGGTVHVEIDSGTWVYEDANGITVRYPDGYADFGPHAIRSAEVPDLKGNHGRGPTGDFGKADSKAGKPADYTKNTWHHHQNMTTMQEVPRSIHDVFHHRGGVSNIKKAATGCVS